MKGERKEKIVHVRFSEKEHLQLKMQMENLDYISVSQFIRDKVLDQRIRIRRDVEYTDRSLRNQINSLSTLVAKIGVDYNQATKKFNTLCKAKRADGSPVINSRSANSYLKKVAMMTTELKDAMDKVIDIVSGLGTEKKLP